MERNYTISSQINLNISPRANIVFQGERGGLWLSWRGFPVSREYHARFKRRATVVPN